jgi:hypothetical protein
MPKKFINSFYDYNKKKDNILAKEESKTFVYKGEDRYKKVM